MADSPKQAEAAQALFSAIADYRGGPLLSSLKDYTEFQDIFKLKKDISIIEKQISDSEIEFIYLSNPEQLTKHIIDLEGEKYSSFDYSRIFFSTNPVSYTHLTLPTICSV